jgi:hypothetical protein
MKEYDLHFVAEVHRKKRRRMMVLGFYASDYRPTQIESLAKKKKITWKGPRWELRRNYGVLGRGSTVKKECTLFGLPGDVFLLNLICRTE